jgi:hypothetical protein
MLITLIRQVTLSYLTVTYRSLPLVTAVLKRFSASHCDFMCALMRCQGAHEHRSLLSWSSSVQMSLYVHTAPECLFLCYCGVVALYMYVTCTSQIYNDILSTNIAWPEDRDVIPPDAEDLIRR